MEITDLQINDLVYDKSFTPSIFPCRIYSIEGRYPRRNKDFNDKPLIDVWVGDGFLSSHIENIEPIPITIEILTKNGFLPFGEDYYYEAKERNSTFKLYRQYGSRWYITVCGVCQYIYYVHELQHALRLCGLNELANDFKI